MQEILATTITIDDLTQYLFKTSNQIDMILDCSSSELTYHNIQNILNNDANLCQKHSLPVYSAITPDQHFKNSSNPDDAKTTQFSLANLLKENKSHYNRLQRKGLHIIREDDILGHTEQFFTQKTADTVLNELENAHVYMTEIHRKTKSEIPATFVHFIATKSTSCVCIKRSSYK